MRFFDLRRAAALAVVAILALPGAARAGKLLSQISVRHAYAPDRVYGEVHRFPAGSRDYSPATLDGWSFRQELPGGAVREVRIARLGSASPYLIATDLFANGRFSTMSHTVLLVFPREGHPAWHVVEDPSGDVHLGAPDGSVLVIDGRDGAVRATSDFRRAPIGPTGTPPRLWHRGFHVRIESVGKSPFLRGTIASVERADGAACRLRTDELFVYDQGPESDRFRFEHPEAFFSFLATRCTDFDAPTPLLREARFEAPPARHGFGEPASPPVPRAPPAPAPPAIAPAVERSPGPVPILVPASSATVHVSPRTRWRTQGGLLWQLFSY